MIILIIKFLKVTTIFTWFQNFVRVHMLEIPFTQLFLHFLSFSVIVHMYIFSLQKLKIHQIIKYLGLTKSQIRQQERYGNEFFRIWCLMFESVLVCIVIFNIPIYGNHNQLSLVKWNLTILFFETCEDNFLHCKDKIHKFAIAKNKTYPGFQKSQIRPNKMFFGSEIDFHKLGIRIVSSYAI